MPAELLPVKLTRPYQKDTYYVNTCQRTQRGASTVGIIIILTIIGAGVYIGLQYIPQYIEASTVDSILNNLGKASKVTPVSSVDALQEMIDKQLDMNQLDDLRDSFKVTQNGDAYVVKVSFERELNLIYEKKPIKYEKSITLR